jgi:pimeloyl-ACP methyl ester carboxylesterase
MKEILRNACLHEKPSPLKGINDRMIPTKRLMQHVYFSGLEGAVPVVFLHGNFTAALYWEETMLALPPKYRGVAPDLRGYGWSEDKPVDARRGMGDWSDDIIALLDALNIISSHFVAWSMSSGILYHLLAEIPQRICSVTFICPMSPYGFGGTRDSRGTPCDEDYAGSGGGSVNAEFVKRIEEGDRSSDDPSSPRNIINSFHYKPPFRSWREEDFLTASLREKIGAERYPGDWVASTNWPRFAPGCWGPANCTSPKYLGEEVSRFLAAFPKRPILWVRGSNDQIVSDCSLFDLGTQGKLGQWADWPGEDEYPSQPMITQTRFVLERYTATGGQLETHVIQDTGHSPHIEKSEEFQRKFFEFLQGHECESR